MTEFKITNWAGSEWTEDAVKKPEPLSPGEYDLRIIDATFDPDTERYQIIVQDVITLAESRFSWFIKTKAGGLNPYSHGTLVSLGKALFGRDVGVPFYEDVINGIVHAEVVQGKEFIREDGSTGHYLSIYSFKPVQSDVYDLVRDSGYPVIAQHTEAVQ